MVHFNFRQICERQPSKRKKNTSKQKRKKNLPKPETDYPSDAHQKYDCIAGGCITVDTLGIFFCSLSLSKVELIWQQKKNLRNKSCSFISIYGYFKYTSPNTQNKPFIWDTLFRNIFIWITFSYFGERSRLHRFFIFFYLFIVFFLRSAYELMLFFYYFFIHWWSKINRIG